LTGCAALSTVGREVAGSAAENAAPARTPERVRSNGRPCRDTELPVRVAAEVREPPAEKTRSIGEEVEANSIRMARAAREAERVWWAERRTRRAAWSGR
jgi:hypothetical protein